jgi:hypothetical protein
MPVSHHEFISPPISDRNLSTRFDRALG